MTMTAAPVRKSITVEASAETAFRVFTQGIDRWWIRAHHIGASDLGQVVLECREGGGWLTRSGAGDDDQRPRPYRDRASGALRCRRRR
jgi:hypothetical protein